MGREGQILLSGSMEDVDLLVGASGRNESAVLGTEVRSCQSCYRGWEKV